MKKFLPDGKVLLRNHKLMRADSNRRPFRFTVRRLSKSAHDWYAARQKFPSNQPKFLLTKA
jgi:hypothetical protein